MGVGRDGSRAGTTAAAAAAAVAVASGRPGTRSSDDRNIASVGSRFAGVLPSLGEHSLTRVEPERREQLSMARNGADLGGGDGR